MHINAEDWHNKTGVGIGGLMVVGVWFAPKGDRKDAFDWRKGFDGQRAV
jgi:hypothetical protein